MKKIILFVFSIGLACGVFAADEFTAAQTKQIEQIVHNYLLSNPQVLMETADKLQKKAMEEEKTKILASVPKAKAELFAATPAKVMAGNPKGSVIMVEFSSYQCGHCRMMAPVVEKILKSNADLQVIFIEWPIFGNEAVYAAKMALAAEKQQKYSALHHAFMQSQESLRPEVADKIAVIQGLDMKKLKTDMDDKALETALKDNFKLAESLQLRGTPTFIFANRDLTKFSLVPGQASEEELVRAIQEVK